MYYLKRTESGNIAKLYKDNTWAVGVGDGLVNRMI
jgi:hypothetical protein